MTDWNRTNMPSKEAGNFYPPAYEPTILDHLEAFADAWLDSLFEFAFVAAVAGYLWGWLQ